LPAARTHRPPSGHERPSRKIHAPAGANSLRGLRLAPRTFCTQGTTWRSPCAATEVLDGFAKACPRRGEASPPGALARALVTVTVTMTMPGTPCDTALETMGR